MVDDAVKRAVYDVVASPHVVMVGIGDAQVGLVVVALPVKRVGGATTVVNVSSDAASRCVVGVVTSSVLK